MLSGMTDKEIETSKTVFYGSLAVLIRIYKTNKHRLTISMLVFSQRKRVTADDVFRQEISTTEM